MKRAAPFLRDQFANPHRHFAPQIPLHPPSILHQPSNRNRNTHLPLGFFTIQRTLRLPSSQIPTKSKCRSGISVDPLARPFLQFRTTSRQLNPSLWTQDINSPWNFSAQLNQSSASSWIVITLAGFLGGLILYAVFPSDIDQVKGEEDPTHPPEVISNQHSMSTELLPGRPETLTPEEEEKLRELWGLTAQILGISINANGQTEQNGGVTKAAVKTKKKRLGFLRRSNKEDGEETTSEPGTSTISVSSEGEDKFGQIKDFNEAVANMSPETIRKTLWGMVKLDHPDALLLRFLRARKWDVEKALVMMISTMKWRATDMHVDEDIMLNGELGALEDSQSTEYAKRKFGIDVLSQMRMGKSFLHGLDKEGRPMCYIRVRLHRPGAQSLESLERYTVFQIETARLMMDTKVDTACVVFDLTDFGLANLDYSPIKFIIKCFEANYPESLGVVLVHKAPWVFQGIWKIIKGWLDPVVAAKVHFTNNRQEMEKFIDASRMMKELDGDEEYLYEYIEPIPGENDIMKDTETRDKLLAERQVIIDQYEKATLEWLKSGGVLSEELKARRNKLADEFRAAYWRLDPYLRARSFYDRVGIFNPGGVVKFYPEKEVKPAAEPPSSDAPNGINPDENPNSETTNELKPDEPQSSETLNGIKPDEAPSSETPNVVKPEEVPSSETPNVVKPEEVPSSETAKSDKPAETQSSEIPNGDKPTVTS